MRRCYQMAPRCLEWVGSLVEECLRSPALPFPSPDGRGNYVVTILRRAAHLEFSLCVHTRSSAKHAHPLLYPLLWERAGVRGRNLYYHSAMYRDQVKHARRLRRASTEAEKFLEQNLRARQGLDVTLCRQLYTHGHVTTKVLSTAHRLHRAPCSR